VRCKLNLPFENIQHRQWTYFEPGKLRQYIVKFAYLRFIITKNYYFYLTFCPSHELAILFHIFKCLIYIKNQYWLLTTTTIDSILF